MAGTKRERLERDFKAATGDGLASSTAGWWLEPWWVRRFNAGSAAWLFLEVDPEHTVPGMSGVQVHIFDATWRRIAKCEFPTGYRMFLLEAGLSSDNPLHEDLLEVRLVSAMEHLNPSAGPDKPRFHETQYYAFRDGCMMLVRVHDGAGRPVRGYYEWAIPARGTPPPEQTAERWLAALEGPDPAAVLSALIWLAGHHLASSERRYKNVTQESVSDSRRFEAVRDHPRTPRVLERLRASANPWIRDGAQQALDVLWAVPAEN